MKNTPKTPTVTRSATSNLMNALRSKHIYYFNPMTKRIVTNHYARYRGIIELRGSIPGVLINNKFVPINTLKAQHAIKPYMLKTRAKRSLKRSAKRK